MNLRDLKVFVATKMANSLTECGIDVDQIEQLKIYDRQIPSNENEDNLVWMRKIDNQSYSAVMRELDQWINNQIIICYMNEDPDRDLSIEIMGNGKGMMAIQGV